jgi:hypothetical protein
MFAKRTAVRAEAQTSIHKMQTVSHFAKHQVNARRDALELRIVASSSVVDSAVKTQIAAPPPCPKT